MKLKLAFHILKAYLEVTEQRTKPLDQLYLSIVTAFKSRLDADQEITANLRAHFLSTKKNTDAALGKSLWDRAKVYKSNFINIYKPNLASECLSGHNMDDMMEICRKKSWLQIKQQKSDGQPLELSEQDCPSSWSPMDFWAFTILHEHPKFQASTFKRKLSSDTEDTAPEKTISRRQQRLRERAEKRKKYEEAKHSNQSGWNAIRSDLATQKMKIELMKMALTIGETEHAKTLFHEAMHLNRTVRTDGTPPSSLGSDSGKEDETVNSNEAVEI